jgi:hypothetical protein
MLFILIMAYLFQAAEGVLELDATTFWAFVNGGAAEAPSQDLLVFFPKTQAQLSFSTSLATSLARRLKLQGDGPSTPIVLGLYDVVKRGGLPSGVHIHTHDSMQLDVILWPAAAGNRDPVKYDWSHDPLSIYATPKGEGKGSSEAPGGSAESTCGANLGEDKEATPGECSSSRSGGSGGSSDEDDHHDHAHALFPSVVGTQRWLKTATSFPADVPSVSLGELWEGKEDDLFQAVAKGMEALQQRLALLVSENARLERELGECRGSAP